MADKPPYTITEKAADYLAKIVEIVTRLEFGTEFKRDIRLHRENRIRTIQSSLAIEGNSLSLDEVTAVIQGKLVADKPSEPTGNPTDFPSDNPPEPEPTENLEYISGITANPIDEYFIPRIQSSISEAQRRGYQDTYRGVWKEEFNSVLIWLEQKYIYQKDKDNVIALEMIVDDYISLLYEIYLIEQGDGYLDDPDERSASGTGFRSGFNMIAGEVYRNVSMRLITDDYDFIVRDYSLAHFE